MLQGPSTNWAVCCWVSVIWMSESSPSNSMLVAGTVRMVSFRLPLGFCVNVTYTSYSPRSSPFTLRALVGVV